jgi:hypothetical protein
VSSANDTLTDSQSVSVIIFFEGDNVIRTQVSLDRHEYQLVKKEAKALGISVAEFVRRAVRDKLPPKSEKPWMRYIGMVESGDPNSSRNIDEIVYGPKP